MPNNLMTNKEVDELCRKPFAHHMDKPFKDSPEIKGVPLPFGLGWLPNPYYKVKS